MILDKITPIDAHIAKKLRQFRIASGITQEKLGDLTGVTFQQIQKYEMARNRISASKLFEFSQLLKKPIGAFFEGAKADKYYYNYNFESEKNQKEDLLRFNKELIPLIRAFNCIKDLQTRKYLVSLASSIASYHKPKKTKHYCS